MEKNFDTIDIFFIVMIIIYLTVLTMFIVIFLYNLLRKDQIKDIKLQKNAKLYKISSYNKNKREIIRSSRKKLNNKKTTSKNQKNTNKGKTTTKRKTNINKKKVQ